MKSIDELRAILHGCPECGQRKATNRDWRRKHNEAKCGDSCWCQAICWEKRSCGSGGSVNVNRDIRDRIVPLLDLAQSMQELRDELDVNNPHPLASRAVAAIDAALERVKRGDSK